MIFNAASLANNNPVNTAASTPFGVDNLSAFQKATDVFETEKQAQGIVFEQTTTPAKQETREPALNANGQDFGQSLKGELERVNTLQQEANTAIQDYAAGGDTPVHQVMLAVNKAELSLQLATQVRNKMVAAYQEVSRMQI
jgi:flagellar hook-basal body complex protein FliE